MDQCMLRFYEPFHEYQQLNFEAVNISVLILAFVSGFHVNSINSVTYLMFVTRLNLTTETKTKKLRVCPLSDRLFKTR
jgi:hypothetical protein